MNEIVLGILYTVGLIAVCVVANLAVNAKMRRDFEKLYGQEAHTPIVYRHRTNNSITLGYYCRVCRHDLEAGQYYCPTCGTRIAWKEGKK